MRQDKDFYRVKLMALFMCAMDALPQSCSWDRAGNRRYVNSDGVSSWSDFNGLNQQLRTENADTGQVTEYSYCPNGNKVREVSSDAVRYFDYSVDNRLVQVRAGTDANSLTTINANTLATVDIRQSANTVLGHTNSFKTGFRYSDFGETEKLVDTHELLDIAYTGGVWDSSTGLYYLNARFYNPATASFMQMDIARNGGDLRATLSLYGYCEGDPVNKVDPTGLWSIDHHQQLTESEAFAAGFSRPYANRMGRGARGPDIFEPAVRPSGVQLHFNMTPKDGQLMLFTSNPWSKARFAPGLKDSRIKKFKQHRSLAEKAWKRGNKMTAVYELGYGLHAIQDIYAHGNILPIQHKRADSTRHFWDTRTKNRSRWSNATTETRKYIKNFKMDKK